MRAGTGGEDEAGEVDRGGRAKANYRSFAEREEGRRRIEAVASVDRIGRFRLPTPLVAGIHLR